MSNFDSTKHSLGKILDRIVEGKIQLPDFQRGWVWDDDHIRDLLVSIARAFPIGSIMLLETGGTAKFQTRPIEGVELPNLASPIEQLILDGQQRLTSLTQVLKIRGAVKTRDAQKREVGRFYYFDIERALEGSATLRDALVGVDGTRVQRTNFGRDVVLDLSTPEQEFEKFFFPCDQILNSDQWEEGLMAFDSARFPRYMAFRQQILNKYREYQIPIIELTKENGKEAVCLVFEKVNTGGVPLSVFELVTASYAADGFNLRDDWYGNPGKGMQGRKKAFAKRPLLKEIEPTDFLQGVSLLYTHRKRQQESERGVTGKELTTVSAKREHVLDMPLAAYQEWADRLTQGFFEVDRFLRQEGFHHPGFLPYRTQLVPLAALMVHLDERWLEPIIKGKLQRWFWNGVLGELYGGAIETRIALDFQDNMAWIHQLGAPEPKTIIDAGFQASRLDTLRTRTSAAYRGIYVLLQREGSQDFFWKIRMIDLDRDDRQIDIHHIFPKAWCRQHGITRLVFNSIVNKTPISYRANRMIGGSAPSVYLEKLKDHSQAQLSEADQDAILRTHLIEPSLLRSDDFDSFYATRKQSLLAIIEKVMGKPSITQERESPPLDDTDDEEAEEDEATN
jgi:hypothetical protein